MQMPIVGSGMCRNTKLNKPPRSGKKCARRGSEKTRLTRRALCVYDLMKSRRSALIWAAWLRGGTRVCSAAWSGAARLGGRAGDQNGAPQKPLGLYHSHDRWELVSRSPNFSNILDRASPRRPEVEAMSELKAGVLRPPR